MRKQPLVHLVRYCDSILRVAQVKDYDQACNGLQVENRGTVSRLAAAVDASLATVQMAIDTGADLLLVHHGLFWSSRQPWTGKTYQLLRLLLDHDLAVYSAHLPLDIHPRLGNNARLCALLGLANPQPFFLEKDQYLGLQARTRLARDELVNRLSGVLRSPVKLLPGGPTVCRRIGVVTGGAGSRLDQAAREGIDTFITGEGPHWTYGRAEELGLNVLYAGHYATETLGVKALAAELARKFQLPWTFLDRPTGL
jgi:dinuclear metal center YbgI/SA1388 family protein